MNISQVLPAIDWLKKYSKVQLRGDLLAGLTVGVMLIPQGMAYAMIAGLPPIYGLYASTIPLFIYALLGSSRQLAVGPVAMVSLLTAAGIAALGVTGLEEYIALAILLAFIVGLIQFLMGVFRLGFIVNFLSHPVISGFTSAAALIIGISQLKHLLGIELSRSHHVHEIIIQAIENIGSINWYAVLVGSIGIAVILFAKRIHKMIPGPLVAVVIGILMVLIFNFQEQGLSIVGEVPSGFPSFEIPNISIARVESLIPIALAISLVSFMESIAVAKAIQNKHKDYKLDANQELMGLGLANLVGSFFKSFPVTGGFSRTAVNDQSGAKTPMAGIISGVIIILTLLFLTSWFYYLPKAILASVIMVAVFGLIDFKEPRYLWKTNKTDFFMLLITFIATLSLGIEQGIGIGVLLSLVMVIFRTTRPHTAVLGKVPGSPFYRKVDRFKSLEIRPDVLAFRFDASLYFANVNHFSDRLAESIAEKPDLKLLILNAESINYIDSTGLHELDNLLADLISQSIELNLTGVKGPVRDRFQRSGFLKKLGEEHFFMAVQDAVNAFDQKPSEHLNKTLEDYVLQTNT